MHKNAQLYILCYLRQGYFDYLNFSILECDFKSNYYFEN